VTPLKYNPTLRVSIRQVCKGLTKTNTLAFYNTKLITAVNGFMIEAFGVNTINF